MFYGEVLGWKVDDSGMEGFDYHLARSDNDAVAGLTFMPEDVAEMPPSWMIYYAVDNADRFVAEAKAAGASVHRDPADVPGDGSLRSAGRSAPDPQGAWFAVTRAKK